MLFFFLKTFLKSSFRFIAELRERYRGFPYTPTYAYISLVFSSLNKGSIVPTSRVVMQMWDDAERVRPSVWHVVSTHKCWAESRKKKKGETALHETVQRDKTGWKASFLRLLQPEVLRSDSQVSRWQSWMRHISFFQSLPGLTYCISWFNCLPLSLLSPSRRHISNRYNLIVLLLDTHHG